MNTSSPAQGELKICSRYLILQIFAQKVPLERPQYRGIKRFDVCQVKHCP